MVKTVDLPLRVYEDLIKVSEELSLMAKKPISVPMAVDLLMEIYRAHLGNPCALDRFSVQMETSNFMSPEEYMNYWDDTIEREAGEGKNPKKQKEPKAST
jgi:hypothetical protein